MPSRGGHSSLTFLDLDGPGTLTDRLFRAIRAAILEGRGEVSTEPSPVT